jgi:SEC-C motif-containing protein
MRSRFTAFCLHEFQYLINTHHLSKRHENELSQLKDSCQQSSWIKLTIHNTQQGQTSDNTGVVEFSAIFNEDQQFFELRENSSFIKENNQWFYVNGKPDIQKISFKIRRNEPCWCFSGKKFKHCHAALL